jgi:hypothetical protein
MTLEELVVAVREDLLDDAVLPYLWSNSQLVRYANDAVKEACKRSILLQKNYTVPVLPGKGNYTIHPSIHTLLLAKLNTQTMPLTQTTDAALSAIHPNWRDQTGTPTQFVRIRHTLRLYPLPIEADVMALESSNIPDDDFDFEEDFNQSLADDLMYWIAYKAFMIPDMDKYNPVRAKEYLALFESAFGVGHSAQYEQIEAATPAYNRIQPIRMC